MALKNAQQYTERLDKIADEVQASSPEMSYYIDLVSDVIEGKKEASTLKFDADEARYMANRFNQKIRQKDADEPFMDEYNKHDYEQVKDVFQHPVAIKKASVPYQKIQD